MKNGNINVSNDDKNVKLLFLCITLKICKPGKYCSESTTLKQFRSTGVYYFI